LTTGAFAAIHRARMRIPEDIAIVGYDEILGGAVGSTAD